MKSSLTLNDIAALFPQSIVSGCGAATMSGLSRDSRSVLPGELFVCIEGARHNSHRYAIEALALGAAGIVVNIGGLESVGVSVPDGIFVLTVKDTRAALRSIGCAYFGNAKKSM